MKLDPVETKENKFDLFVKIIDKLKLINDRLENIPKNKVS